MRQPVGQRSSCSHLLQRALATAIIVLASVSMASCHAPAKPEALQLIQECGGPIFDELNAEPSAESLSPGAEGRAMIRCAELVSDAACREAILDGYPTAAACRDAYCPHFPQVGAARPWACPAPGEDTEHWDELVNRELTVVWGFLYQILEHEAEARLIHGRHRRTWLGWLDDFLGAPPEPESERRWGQVALLVNDLERAGDTDALASIRTVVVITHAWRRNLTDPWYTESPRPLTAEQDADLEAWLRLAGRSRD